MTQSKVWAWVLALVFCFCFFYKASAQGNLTSQCASNPQSDPSCAGYITINTHVIGDDQYVYVPLQFPFPFYGQIFTHSWMYDNGVVGFLDPTGGYNGGQDYFSQPLNGNLGPRFSYMIAPLWTDLLNYNGTFRTEGTADYQKYYWENISQWGYPDRLNTFDLEIRPTGYIGVNYTLINIGDYPVSTGIVGNPALGEYQQQFYSPPGGTVTSLQSWNTYSGANVCDTDPLISTSCPGYQQAYHDLQCSINPLYGTTCSGYQQAYFNQQCMVDPLYDSGCPGYQQAFFEQQCSLDPLYNVECPGYQEAYVKKNLLQQEDPQTFQTSLSTTEPEVVVNLDGSITTEVPLVADPIVNREITKNSTPPKKEEKKEETATKNNTSKKDDQPKTTVKRQGPPPDPSKQTASEKEFEKEVVSQNQSIATMSAVPGFSSYTNSILPDTNLLNMQREYNKQPEDNRRAQRLLGGAQDRLHQDMVGDQYRR